MATVIGRGYNGTSNVSSGLGSNSVGSNNSVRVTPPDVNGVQHTIVPNTVSNSGANGFASEMSSLVGSTDFLNAMYQDIMNVSERHSALSQANAERQMEYQTMSDHYAMNWSALEAQKNREWQEQLSNTAHQREIEDLLKAGLNPILSAGGQGATTPVGSAGSGYSSNGAAGQVDMTNPANIMQNYFGDILNSANIMAQLETQKQITADNNATTRFASMNGLEGALASAGAVMGSARLQAETQRSEGQKNREFNALNAFINNSKDFARQQLINKGNMDTAIENHYNNPYGTATNLGRFIGGIVDAGNEMYRNKTKFQSNHGAGDAVYWMGYK